MLKTSLTIFTIILLSASVSGQKYFTRNGMVKFFSEAPLENIEAVNNQASCIVDVSTGDVISKILMEAFHFEKALMQEHFNENYVESDKYPQAILKARISNLTTIDFKSSEAQKVILHGDLTLHNITQKVNIEGSFTNREGTFLTQAKFTIKPEDYNIKIPKPVKEKIAKNIEVTLEFELKEFKR